MTRAVFVNTCLHIESALPTLVPNSARGVIWCESIICLAFLRTCWTGELEFDTVQTKSQMSQSCSDARSGLDPFCQRSMGRTVKDMLGAVRESGLKSGLIRLWLLQRRKGPRQRILRRSGASTDPEARKVLAFLAAHPAQELPFGVALPYEWVKSMIEIRKSAFINETYGSRRGWKNQSRTMACRACGHNIVIGHICHHTPRTTKRTARSALRQRYVSIEASHETSAKLRFQQQRHADSLEK